MPQSSRISVNGKLCLTIIRLNAARGGCHLSTRNIIFIALRRIGSSLRTANNNVINLTYKRIGLAADSSNRHSKGGMCDSSFTHKAGIGISVRQERTHRTDWVAAIDRKCGIAVCIVQCQSDPLLLREPDIEHIIIKFSRKAQFPLTGIILVPNCLDCIFIISMVCFKQNLLIWSTRAFLHAECEVGIPSQASRFRRQPQHSFLCHEAATHSL